MKCPSKEGCDNKYTTGNVEKAFQWIRLYRIPVFPKFWRPIKLIFYCGGHGNFMYIDGEWWWYSYFHPGLPLEEEAIAPCPKKCHHDNYLDKLNNVHRGKDSMYYCSHCSWHGKHITPIKCDGICNDCMLSYVKKDDDGIEVFACKAEDDPEIEVTVEDPFKEMIEEEE